MSCLNSAGRVLIVDDEQVIADTLAMILSRSGYVTKVAYSGEQAIEVADVFKPDLLITDAVMSGITGTEAATRIAGFLPSCKVILFSGLRRFLSCCAFSNISEGRRSLGNGVDLSIGSGTQRLRN
jgi:DNA-binding NtrC family response regulator